MKILHILTAVLFVAFSFVACDKMPTNGRLDGNWQLMTIATHDSITGEKYANVISKKADQIFWAFQIDLMTISSTKFDVNGLSETSTCRFKYGNGKLDITETYIHYHDQDSLLEDPTTTALEVAGITGNAELFNVKRLTRKSMILNNENKELTFRKF